MVKELTSAAFDAEVLKSEQPVLVDFWAPWCGPCRMMGPVVEQLAAQYEGKLKVCKVNVDENGDTAAQYGIMSIPSILLFKGGAVVDQSVGAVGKPKLEAMIQKAL